MRIMIMGGDGFLGWPTSLQLSSEGHFVTIVDSFARRNADIELGYESLTPIRTMNERLNVWKNKTGNKILFKRLDLSKNYRGLLGIIIKLRPDIIIHFAEQRSAPYSMKTFYHRRATIDNNVNVTHNILCAIVESGRDVHFIPVGMVGTSIITKPNDIGGTTVYSGTGSIFELSKIFDLEMFKFYNRNDKVRITEARLGIVWGSNTDKTEIDEKLINRFDYDGDYGTVLNRFIVQGVCGYPLTIYGNGKQKRAFIHIKDAIDFIKHAMEYPPKCGDPLRSIEGAAEEISILDLATLVSSITGTKAKHYQDPRNEVNWVAGKLLLDGRLVHGEEKRITEKEIENICRMVHDYKGRCDFSKMAATSIWNKDKRIDLEGA